MEVKKQRYYSLDVFRGATVAFMILVNNQGGPAYAPLDHAPWHGLTPTDIVFPFFLFAVGNSLSFVMPGLKAAGTRIFLTKVLRRAALIFTIGFLLNWFPFLRWQDNDLVFKGWTWINDHGTESGVRIFGVLGRIACAYLIASLIIYFFSTRLLVAVSIFLLLLYWWMCVQFGAAGDPFSLEGYFGTALDKQLLGEAHLYHGEGVAFDPEGIAGTIPAAVSVVFGYLTGKFIQEKGKSYEMLTHLFIWHFVLLAVSYWWNMVFPINKKLWTSSYVICTTALAQSTLATLVFWIEMRGYKGRITSFFNSFGKNPLFIFVLSGVVPRILNLVRLQNDSNQASGSLHTSPLQWFYIHVCERAAFGNEKLASLMYSLIFVGFYWVVAFILEKKKIFVKV